MRVPALVVPVVDGSCARAASGESGVGVTGYDAPLRRSDPPEDGAIGSPLRSISAKKLSESLFWSSSRFATFGERTSASATPPDGAAPVRGLPLTPIPRALSAWSRRAAANRGGLLWNALPLEFASPRLKLSALIGPT